MGTQGFWTADLEATLERMNATTLQFSTAASRPAASSSTEGMMHFATDTNVLSYDNGGSWVNIALAPVSGETDVATSETTTSASYGDLSTAGPAVTLSPGATKDHMIFVSAFMGIGGANRKALMSVAVSGASAVDKNAAQVAYDGTSANLWTATQFMLAASAADATAHTAKYKISATTVTGTFSLRRLTAHVI